MPDLPGEGQEDSRMSKAKEGLGFSESPDGPLNKKEPPNTERLKFINQKEDFGYLI